MFNPSTQPCPSALSSFSHEVPQDAALLFVSCDVRLPLSDISLLSPNIQLVPARHRSGRVSELSLMKRNLFSKGPNALVDFAQGSLRHLGEPARMLSTRNSFSESARESSRPQSQTASEPRQRLQCIRLRCNKHRYDRRGETDCFTDRGRAFRALSFAFPSSFKKRLIPTVHHTLELLAVGIGTVHGIIPHIRIEVHPALVPHRVGLHEPPERWGRTSAPCSNRARPRPATSGRCTGTARRCPPPARHIRRSG